MPEVIAVRVMTAVTGSVRALQKVAVSMEEVKAGNSHGCQHERSALLKRTLVHIVSRLSTVWY